MYSNWHTNNIRLVICCRETVRRSFLNIDFRDVGKKRELSAEPNSVVDKIIEITRKLLSFVWYSLTSFVSRPNSGIIIVYHFG